jgi:tetratricopeptide (TPR) repeat protein
LAFENGGQFDSRWQEKRSKTTMEKMKESFPDNFQTPLAEGLLLKSEENYQAAIDYFNRATNIEPNIFRTYMEKCYI